LIKVCNSFRKLQNHAFRALADRDRLSGKRFLFRSISTPWKRKNQTIPLDAFMEEKKRELLQTVTVCESPSN
jgi:hypothetical protein